MKAVAANSTSEITDRKRAEALLRSIVEHATDGLLTIGQGGMVESVNPACERLFGYQSGEIPGQNIATLIPEFLLDDQVPGGLTSTLLAQAKHHGAARGEVKARRKSGSTLSVEISVTAFLMEDGWHYCCILRDITSARLAEKKLLDNAARFRAVIDSALDGLITTNEKGVIQSFNRSAQRTFGYSDEEVIGRKIDILIPEKQHNPLGNYVGNLLADGETKVVGIGREVKARRKDGTVFPMDLTISAIQIGEETAYVSVVRDISTRKMVEENSAQLMATIVASSDDAIISKTLDGQITSWNMGAERMFGYKASEAIGRSITIILPPDKMAEEKMILARLNNGQEVQHLETVRRRKDGQLVDVAVTLSPLRDSLGKLIGASKIVRNISERKRIEAAMLRHTEALEAANRELDAFAYAASHDLKAPLRVIYNAVNWLEEDLAAHLTPETQANMNLLRRRVARMEKLLNDLLEYSRIGREPDSKYAESVRGYALMENILELLDPPEGFTVRVSPAFAAIQVYRMPLQQIFINLISNAIKHHDKAAGTIEVSVEDIGAYHRFSVRDDGPGIDPRYHQQIFGMFQTLKPRDHVEGSGMGLAMVRKHIEIAGCTIELDSAVGEGSTFRFTWPKQSQKQEKTPEPIAAGETLWP